MQVPLYQPLAPPPHLQHWMQGVLPGYRFHVVAGMVAADHGSWIQILIKPKAPGAELVTGMPVVARILMALGFLGGLLPGLVFVIVYYAALSSTIDKVKAQIAAALTGQPIPPGPGLPAHMTGAPGSMPMGGMPGAPMPMAPPRPRSSINPLAPVWMIVVMVLLFGASGTAGALAYDEGWERIDRKQSQIEYVEERLDTAKERYKRTKKGKKPPSGCPDDGSYYSGYGPKECHGCLSHSVKPTYVEPEYKVHRRKKDKDWLVCPPIEVFENEVDDRQRAVDWATEDLEEAQQAALILTPAAGGLFIGFLAFLVIWIRKNKVMRKKRAEELAAPVT